MTDKKKAVKAEKNATRMDLLIQEIDKVISRNKPSDYDVKVDKKKKK